MEFKTIEGVPIVSTGTYSLGTGEATFTADDLASAVLAANDPTVSLPRIKIGHTDRRFESDPALDGEPAMGTVRNLTLSDDGQTIIGDLTDVPAWLADSMQSAYPGRSIEGGFNYKAPSGHDYKLAISNLALLGTEWPGVGSLDDLRDVLSKNGKVNDVEASSERVVMASVGQKIVPETEASLDVGGIPRAFAADLTAGRVPTGGADASSWWARSVEAHDDGTLTLLVDAAGKLLRLPFTVADKTINYGEPQPVTASSGSLKTMQGPRVLASWPSNSQPAPRPEVITMQINGTDVSQAVLAARLGLPEDADEPTILAALNDDEAGSSDEAATSDTTATATSVETPAPSTATGTVTIDAERLAALEADAKAGAEAARTLAKREHDAQITAAINAGKIVAKSRPSWEARFESAPEEATRLLTASVEDGGLAAVVPVDQVEAGRAGDGDGQNIEASAPRLLPELREVAA